METQHNKNIIKCKFDYVNICVKSLVLIIFVILLLINVFSNFNYEKNISIYSSVFLLVVSLLSLISVRKHMGLLIVFLFIFYCNYSIVSFNFFNDNTNVSLYGSFSHTRETIIALYCLILFNLIIYLFLPQKISEIPRNISFTESKNSNILIVLGTCAILFVILIFGFTRPTMDSERGTPSTFYEYSIILFIVGFYYCGRKKALQVLLIFTALLFCLQNFMYGGRVTGLQLILVIYLLNFYKIKKSIVFLLGFVFILILSCIGLFRADFSLSFSQLDATLQNLFDKGFALDTAYSAYHTSVTFIKVQEMTSTQTIFSMFGRFILSLIFGGSAIKNSNLSEYTAQYFIHSNGGVLPIYMYFYLGFVGVILIAAFVSLYIKNICIKPNNGIKYCIFVYFICTVPRWYLYSPSQLIRGMILLILVFYAYRFADLLIKGKLIKKT